MTKEQEIKGILVHFFREGTKGDYLDALNNAIKEMKQVSSSNVIPDVIESFEDATKPLMKYLSENHHPHTKCIVESNSSEIVEGVKCFNSDEFLID